MTVSCFRSKMMLMSSLAAMALAIAPSAFAQEAAPAASGDSAKPVPDSDLVVTGTRIPRDGATAPTPVTA